MRRLASSLLAIAAWLLAGCGGGDGAETGSVAPGAGASGGGAGAAQAGQGGAGASGAGGQGGAGAAGAGAAGGGGSGQSGAGQGGAGQGGAGQGGAGQAGAGQGGAGGCCATAADCENIVNARCVQGQCKPLPASNPVGVPPLCWLQSDCGSGAQCVGAQVCACGADACDPVPDTLGHCEKLASGQCRSEADCPDFQSCMPPGSPAGCGICMPPENPCSSDAECAAQGDAFICGQDPDTCVCGASCIEGCKSDGECGEGQVCNGKHRCEAKGCKTQADCPENFGCGTQPESGFCNRKSCKADGECEGFCVQGQCYGQLGYCGALPP